MGNFHCIPSSCARVVWREYLPPSIRYRYEGKDWQYVDGDDYELEQPSGQCNTKYFISAEATYQGRDIGSLISCGETIKINAIKTFDGNILAVNNIENLQTLAFGFEVTWENPQLNTITTEIVPVRGFSLRRSFGLGSLEYRDGCYSNGYRSGAKAIRNVEIVRVDGQPDNCGDCTLNIYKNGEIVHTQTRDVCPEVEQLDCRLSEQVNQITIEKLPYLERIEVVPYSYISFGGNVFRGDVPDECLNILKNLTTQIIPLPGKVPTPDNGAFNAENRGFVQQICSHSDCPPPEYEVICDCDCESCPDGTCAKECDDHICCYDTSTGQAVLEIPLDQYCGGKN